MSADRLAGPVADPPQNCRKHIGTAVEQIGVFVAALGNQPDIFGHVRVGRTAPLAVHNSVEVRRISGVGRFQNALAVSLNKEKWRVRTRTSHACSRPV